VPCRDSPGTSAQTIGNKEAAAPRFLAPETFPAGIVPRSSRHAGQYDSRGHRDEFRYCTYEYVRHDCSGGFMTFGGPQGPTEPPRHCGRRVRMLMKPVDWLVLACALSLVGVAVGTLVLIIHEVKEFERRWGYRK